MPYGQFSHCEMECKAKVKEVEAMRRIDKYILKY